MSQTAAPNNVRGLRSNSPANAQNGGYLLGRLDSQPGAAQQLSFQTIRRILLGGKEYQLGFSFVGGVLPASQLLGLHRFSRGVTFPANFGEYNGAISQAGGSATATGSTVITVSQALAATPTSFSNIGTITIAASSVTPTFSTSGSQISFAPGDVLQITAPSSADATFANFYCTLVGFKS